MRKTSNSTHDIISTIINILRRDTVLLMSTFDDILTYNPMTEASSVTGQCYLKDEHTSSLGMAMLMMADEDKRSELSLRNDTYLNAPIDYMLNIIKGLGFRIVHQYDFQAPTRRWETAYFFHNGLTNVLITMTTCGYSVDSAMMHYNWKSSSPSSQDHLIIGSEDIREALKHKYAKLLKDGAFLQRWLISPVDRFCKYPSVSRTTTETEQIVRNNLPSSVL